MKILKAAIRTLVLVGIMIAMSSVFAEESPGNVYRQQVNKPLSEVYDKVYKSLEEARFFVVFELVLYQGDFDRPLWCPAPALQYLTKTNAIACALCLVAKHHSIAELINTTVSEY